ncbi:MAG: hypothetical protein AB9903_29080 [Vulcanimicrobiota bacterium]
MLKSLSILSACVFLTALIFLLSHASFADTAPRPPMPDEKGDYRNCRIHRYWLIVDKDRVNGLNGRLSPDFPKNWKSCDSQWPQNPAINEWPVVFKFHPDMVLRAALINSCMVMKDDNKGNPWLMVSVDINRICFVRANSRYIKPVYVSDE